MKGVPASNNNIVTSPSNAMYTQALSATQVERLQNSRQMIKYHNVSFSVKNMVFRNITYSSNVFCTIVSAVTIPVTIWSMEWDKLGYLIIILIVQPIAQQACGTASLQNIVVTSDSKRYNNSVLLQYIEYIILLCYYSTLNI